MRPPVVPRRHDVEEERVHVVIERLVVEEHLGEQTQVPAPRPLPPAVDLVERYKVVPVDLVPRGVLERALHAVPRKRLEIAVVAQAELADVDGVLLAKHLRVRGEVPREQHVPPKLDLGDVSDARNLGWVLRHRARCPQLFDFLLPAERLRVLLLGRAGRRLVLVQFHLVGAETRRPPDFQARVCLVLPVRLALRLDKLAPGVWRLSLRRNRLLPLPDLLLGFLRGHRLFRNRCCLFALGVFLLVLLRVGPLDVLVKVDSSDRDPFV